MRCLKSTFDIRVDFVDFDAVGAWRGDRQDVQSHTQSLAHSDTMARLLGGREVYQNQEQIILSPGHDGRYLMNRFILFGYVSLLVLE